MTTEHSSTGHSSTGYKSTAQSGAAGAEPKKSRSQGELRAESSRARAELASTLDAIEYKFNLPKQIKITTRRVKFGLHKLGDENPAALIGIALGAAALSVGAVWLGIKAAQARR